MNVLPKFFNYDEEGPTDNGYETIQDFFLSWTLRGSNSLYQKDNYLLHYYSKRVLYSLIYGYNNSEVFTVNFCNLDNFEVIEVKTKRQFNRIDLLAEVKVIVNQQIEDYVLNIENKWYTTIRENQLYNYVNRLKQSYYFSEIKLVNIVIFCDKCIINLDPNQINICKDNEYKYTSIDELKVIAELNKYGKTGNYLFDEYWIHSFR